MFRKLPCYSSGIEFRKYANDLAKELFRKSIHICTALVPFLLSYAYVPVICTLSAVLVLYIAAESFRHSGKNIPIISAITAAAARKRDENKFVLGPVTLASGVIITALIFNPKCASLGIYALAFGDGLASLTGKMFGHISIPLTKGKTVAGSLACFIAIFLSSFTVTGVTSYSLILALVGMILEMLPLKDFDNLIIPLSISFVAQFFMHI